MGSGAQSFQTNASSECLSSCFCCCCLLFAVSRDFITCMELQWRVLWTCCFGHSCELAMVVNIEFLIVVAVVDAVTVVAVVISHGASLCSWWLLVLCAGCYCCHCCYCCSIVVLRTSCPVCKPNWGCCSREWDQDLVGIHLTNKDDQWFLTTV